VGLEVGLVILLRRKTKKLGKKERLKLSMQSIVSRSGVGAIFPKNGSLITMEETDQKKRNNQSFVKRPGKQAQYCRRKNGVSDARQISSVGKNVGGNHAKGKSKKDPSCVRARISGENGTAKKRHLRGLQCSSGTRTRLGRRRIRKGKMWEGGGRNRNLDETAARTAKGERPASSSGVAKKKRDP